MSPNPSTLAEKEQVHECCGCSCGVCEDGHQSGMHTTECFERFFKEFSNDQANNNR